MAYILNAKVNGEWVGIPAIQGEQGETGQTGATGNGIVSIEKTGTSGLVDTYTVTYTNGDTDTFTVTNGQNGTVSDVQINGTSILVNGVADIGIVDNVLSTSTTSALSANQGKVLQDEITHLQGIGRFLALWDATTGLAETNPPVSPYIYKTGDYFIVGVVGSTNYKPSGSSYTTGVASMTVETNTIEVGNVYYYDGTTWKLQAGGGGGTITDVLQNGTSVVTSGVASVTVPTQASDIGAQATLVSGTNIKTINNNSILGSGNLAINAVTFRDWS